MHMIAGGRGAQFEHKSFSQCLHGEEERLGEFFSASNKLPGTVRKLTGNQFSSILTRSKMRLSAFQSPMHEQRQGKIVTGKIPVIISA